MPNCKFFLWLAALVPLTACAPKQAFAAAITPTEAEAEIESIDPPWIDGNYALSPTSCDEALNSQVSINRRELVDPSGTIQPARIPFDKTGRESAVFSGGSAAGIPRSVYHAFTYEKNGAVSLTVFIEIPFEDVETIKTSIESRPESSRTAELGPLPLLYTRFSFPYEPTRAQFEERLNSIGSEQYFLLELCS